MLVFIGFISLISAAGALILFFNKGEQAQKIKSILKEIFNNLTDLFKNLKDLFNLIKEIITKDKDESEDIKLSLDKQATKKEDQGDSANPVIQFSDNQTPQEIENKNIP